MCKLVLVNVWSILFQIWDASRSKSIRTMEGHRLRVGALAWSSSVLSSGSRDKNILQRDVRAQDDYISKLSGHKSEVRTTALQLGHSVLLSVWVALYKPHVICSHATLSPVI